MGDSPLPQLRLPQHRSTTASRSVYLFEMLSRAVRPALGAGNAALARTVVPQAAGYATLREIEGRLKSIRNIEKITKTMKIVASTKLTRAQKAMRDSRSYGDVQQSFRRSRDKAIGREEDAFGCCKLRQRPLWWYPFRSDTYSPPNA